MTYEYKTKGVCARTINFSIEDGKVTGVKFNGGCNGNGKGVSALVDGMDVDEAISRMKGITCGMKSTSCPDQLAKALEETKNA